MEQRAWSTLLVGFAVLMLWSSYTPVFAGDTTYEALSSIVQEITQGSYGEFKFRATSPVLPATGNPKQSPYDLDCVTAEFLAKDLTFTDPDTAVTSDVDFLNWLSIDPLTYCYPLPSFEGPEVTVTIVVPSDAEVGTYGAKLVAKGPEGMGWGEAAGVHIMFHVVAFTPTDTTPPVVTFYEPTEGAHFVLGHRVPVDFTAIDHESPVNDWTAVLNPNTTFATDVAPLLSETAITDGIEVEGTIFTALPVGSETIQAIGYYTLAVTATSDGGTSDPALRHFDVNYDVGVLAPHMTAGTLICDKSANKCGGTGSDLQIKFRVKAFEPPDTSTTISSTEVFVRDESVRVKVVRDSDNIAVIDRLFGGNANLNVTISGNTGDAPGTGEYLTKVSWTTLANGNYTIYVYFQDYAGNDFLQFKKSFTVQD